MTHQQSPGLFNKRSPRGREEAVDRGGEDMDDDNEESLTRIVQDEEAFTIKEDATPNTSMLERRAINQPYASISPVKNIKHGLSMMYRNEA